MFEIAPQPREKLRKPTSDEHGAEKFQVDWQLYPLECPGQPLTIQQCHHEE